MSKSSRLDSYIPDVNTGYHGSGNSPVPPPFFHKEVTLANPPPEIVIHGKSTLMRTMAMKRDRNVKIILQIMEKNRRNRKEALEFSKRINRAKCNPNVFLMGRKDT